MCWMRGGHRAAWAPVVRVQLLARDVILATELPHALSVRNALEGTVVDVTDDDDEVLVRVDIGGRERSLAHHAAAVEALRLQRGIARVGADQGGVPARAQRSGVPEATTPAS